MSGEVQVEKRIRTAGALVTTGLLVELATLFSGSPTAFLIFVLLGGLLIGAGVLTFLTGLVSR